MIANSKERLKTEKARRRFLDVWTVVGAILLTAVFVYLLNILSVPVGIVIWTIIIVFCLRAPVNWLEKKGVSRGVGTTLAYLLMFAVLSLATLLMFSPVFGIGSQFADLAESLPSYVQHFIGWGNDIYNQYASILENETVRQWIDEAQKTLSTWAASVASASASGIVSVGISVVNSFVAIGFALVIAFWLLLELPALGRECRRLVGEHREEELHMFHMTFTRVMGGYIKGTLLQCALIGLGCGVLFSVLGIPNSAALGGIAGLLNIIPIIGPWLGGLLAAVVSLFVSPLAALIALVGTIAIQQFVYTFVSPKIMADSVDIHPALTMLALMFGSALGGAMSGLMGSLVGMLASIPLVAVAKSVFVYYFEKRTNRRLVAEDGVFFKGASSDEDELDPVADATAPSPSNTGSLKLIDLNEAKHALFPDADDKDK